MGVSTSGLKKVPYAIFDRMICNPNELEDLVVEKLGAAYRLGAVVDLEQLGLEKWPFNRAGKVSRLDLERIVTSYLASKGG